MAEYDDSKDEVLDSRILDSETSTGAGYEVLLVRRDRGDIKIQIQPFYHDKKNDKQYNKLGRIKYSWFARIARAVKEMYDGLNEFL